MQDLKSTPITFSLEGMDRLFRAHGHTLHDVAQLRSGTFPRIPDIVFGQVLISLLVYIFFKDSSIILFYIENRVS